MKLLVKYYTTLLSGIMIAFTGCREKTPEVIIINEKDAKEVAFEDVATNIRVVPLISDEPLASIKNVVSYGNEVLACDDDEKIVYYFVDGKLVSKLNRIGRGPGEYITIRRFTYAPAQKMLYVMTPDKVLWYTIPDMKHCGDTPLKFDTQHISMHDENRFFALCFINDKWRTVLIDIKTGEITQELQVITIYAMRDSFHSMTSYTEKNHYYSLFGYNNSVVAVNDSNKVETLLTYNYGNMNIEQKYTDFDKYYDPANAFKIAEFINEQTDYLDENGRNIIVTVSSPRINDKGEISFWYAHYISPSGEFFYYKYNPVDKTSVNLRGFRMKGIGSPITPNALSDTGYIKIFQGNNRWLKTEEKPSDLAKELIQTIENQNDDNPVLLFFDLK